MRQAHHLYFPNLKPNFSYIHLPAGLWNYRKTVRIAAISRPHQRYIGFRLTSDLGQPRHCFFSSALPLTPEFYLYDPFSHPLDLHKEIHSVMSSVPAAAGGSWGAFIKVQMAPFIIWSECVPGPPRLRSVILDLSLITSNLPA